MRGLVVQRDTDYVITGIRELPSGNFEASWTLLHGPGYRGKLFIPRAQLEIIPQLVQHAVETLKLPPTTPR
jgi:hypothetical protein